MCFAAMAKEIRNERGISQGFLASQVGVTQATWSKYENQERPIPEDVAYKAAKVLNSPRLLAEYYYEKRGEFFNVPLLNNVDDNTIVILDSLIEEAAELIKYSQGLKKVIKNKKSRDQLTNAEWEKLMQCEEQIADLFPALKLHLVKMSEVFGLDIEKLERRIQRKLKQKGYVK